MDFNHIAPPAGCSATFYIYIPQIPSLCSPLSHHSLSMPGSLDLGFLPPLSLLLTLYSFLGLSPALSGRLGSLLWNFLLSHCLLDLCSFCLEDMGVLTGSPAGFLCLTIDFCYTGCSLVPACLHLPDACSFCLSIVSCKILSFLIYNSAWEQISLLHHILDYMGTGSLWEGFCAIWDSRHFLLSYSGFLT